MNSTSLDPKSLSIACLVAALVLRGPGVKSFFSLQTGIEHDSRLEQMNQAERADKAREIK
jgi:hypothetical protein